MLLTVSKILTSPKILVRVLLILTKRVVVNYYFLKTDYRPSYTQISIAKNSFGDTKAGMLTDYSKRIGV